MPNLLSFEWDRFIDGFDVVALNTDDFEIDTSSLPFDVDDLVEQGVDLGTIDEDLDVSVSERASPETAQLIRTVQQEELLELQARAPAVSHYLLARSNTRVRYQPLDENPGLFMEFSETPTTLEGAKTFADKYGLVSQAPMIFTERAPCAKIFMEFYFYIRVMRELVQVWHSCEQTNDFESIAQDWNHHLSSARVVFKKFPGVPRPRLLLEPESLRDGMFLQLANAISGNSLLRRCICCPTWFAYGTGTGRRKSAHYCSDRCRKAAFNMRKEGQQ